VPHDAAISANILPGDVTGLRTAARSRCLPASFRSYLQFPAREPIFDTVWIEPDISDHHLLPTGIFALWKRPGD